MNELQIFSNPEFGQVRTVEIGGEAWLVGKDVAEALGYSNPRDALAKHVDGEDKKSVAFRDGTSGNPNVTIVNESGLYALVMSSKLPGAKRFRRWVTSEVLPALRRSGSYVLSKKESEQIKLLQELQAELTEWERIENQFDGCAAYHRKAYESARSHRDVCRAHISRAKPVIANLITQLGNIPMIK